MPLTVTREPKPAKKAGPERRCVATGETSPVGGLLRFAIDLDGTVFPDPSAIAPGRGVWVSANRASVDLAVKRNGFARSVKGPVKPAANLSSLAEAALAKRCLDLLGMAKRSGGILVGFEKVEDSIRSKAPAWRIEASDGADDGRGKLDRLTAGLHGAIPVCGCFSAEELGVALGRDRVIHGLLSQGRLAEKWSAEIDRLRGFREITPESWQISSSANIERDEQGTGA
jgi:predicted RNA-binding protein YlxR (DUF448 family)